MSVRSSVEPPTQAQASADDRIRPAWSDRRGPEVPQVTVVIPTYNEAANITSLLERLELALAHLDHEIIVVDDDSPDRTWAVAGQVAERNRRVRVLRRIGRRGLSSAVLEGASLARGRSVAVIDGDLQHDESVLPVMVAAVLDGADVAIGSRAIDGGSYGDFGPGRRLISWAGASLARTLLGVRVSDPMSGYFVVSRHHLDTVRPTLDGQGFKLLLEILAHAPGARVHETGYRFRLRSAGTTKLGTGVALAFVVSVLSMAARQRLVRPGFAGYAPIALFALGLRTSLVELLHEVSPVLPAAVRPMTAWSAAAIFEVAVLIEFGMHNRWTFRGPPNTAIGRLGSLWRFHLVAAHTTVAVLGVGAVIDRLLRHPGLEGTAAAACGFALGTLGALAVVAASYQLNRTFTWRQDRTGAVPR